MQRFQATMTAAGGFDRPVPSGFAYATIGPESLIDLVDVGGAALGLDAPIQLTGDTQACRRVRPLRVTGGNVDTILELLLWKACETPIACKRNPAIVAQAYPALAGGAVVYERLLRLPFAGRRTGAIHVNGDTGKAFDWGVFGVKFLDTKAVAGAARDMYTLIDSGTETPAALLGVALDGMTVQLGGLDRHLDFDEIELWGKGDAAAVELDCRGEAYDLCR